MTGPAPVTLRELAGRPLADLRGVGPKLGAALAAMELRTVLDLLTHYPRRYVDRTHRSDIAALAPGEEATVFGTVQRVHGRRTRNRRSLVEAVVHDGTSSFTVTFFNQPWRERQLAVGSEVSVFGKLDVYRGRRQMTNPVVDVLGRSGVDDDRTGVVVPVYPQSGKADVSTWQLRTLVREVLERTLGSRARGLADPLDEALLDRLDLVDRATAYRAVHRPETLAEAHAARRRLVFDEFLRMQVGLVARKRALAAGAQGIRHRVDGALVDAFHARLPFPLTGDQRRAIAQIVDDLGAAAPMHRLLQGDVGSGKTVVALSALLVAVEGGHSGALMAPTEVLAEQHHLSARALLEGLTVDAPGSLLGERPVRVELLTNRTPAADRRAIQAGLAAGEVDVVVGTHALLYGDEPFPRLGLAVVDEQHRFGVEQRALLRDRGRRRDRTAGADAGTYTGPHTGPDADTGADAGPVPDVLVMTATPIPRTAAMLVYGDLDKSELREMPPGRAPIETEVVGADPLDQERAWKRLREEVGEGRQAFVVCPLVEGSGKVEARAATEELERLAAEELAGLRLGLLHGQMAPREKEAAMAGFRAGEIDVLVATTVVEVGVDVPNATVMVVLDADRFGLSQLHQLRGRVGRGGGAAWCFLVAEPTTAEGSARLEAMATSTDGFLLAERDLEIRGAGEVFGERQSGFSDLKLGRIPRDEAVVVEARAIAEAILDGDADLREHPVLREEVEDLLGEDVEFLFKA